MNGNAALATLTLFLVLAAAVACDCAANRIPNRLSVAAAVAGLAFSVAPHGIGLWDALQGGGLGFAVFIPLYALRAVGAGDAKLMAAAGTYLGLAGTTVALFYALALGGLVAAFYAWKHGAAAQSLGHLRTFFYASAARVASGGLPRADDMPVSRLRAPYAIAIAGGVALQMLTKVLVQGGIA